MRRAVNKQNKAVEAASIERMFFLIQFNRFPGGTRHILTMSYDDGADADRRLVEIFNRYGIRGTFHLNSGFFDMEGKISRKEVSALYQGHEVSCHTLTHPYLERLPAVSVAKEILADRENLEPLCGYPVRGMSYPYGTYSEGVLKALESCGIVYSRTTQATHNFGFPRDFLTWHPTCHHSDRLMEHAAQFLEDQACPWRSDLFYVWGHSYEFDRNDNWELIEEFCAKVSGQKEVWYATNIEIYDYWQALKALRISADGRMLHNPSAAPVWVSANGETVEIKGGATVRL